MSEKNNGSEVSGFSDAPTLRIPEAFIVLSPDQVNGDKTYPGTVGLKYGPTKEDWIRLPYTSMKKLIDFCRENSSLFNSQLQKEREKNQVTDL
ncbi:hypothetical protein [Methanosarcina acetivorans]|uniref:Uncharacterized protein n=1 Tax=Methanosarcina acetivorans (strain ATCC 35395 / DSM 2834 / JCM 12185 / C2A) TaxID=188937 RepID=Q8TM69_METAC|nr:hypothetical protein [Methanosarcina acetivorans]AAM06178.1 predicted protein [Methanosarcina acetivorans C2A]